MYTVSDEFVEALDEVIEDRSTAATSSYINRQERHRTSSTRSNCKFGHLRRRRIEGTKSNNRGYTQLGNPLPPCQYPQYAAPYLIRSFLLNRRKHARTATSPRKQKTLLIGTRIAPVKTTKPTIPHQRTRITLLHMHNLVKRWPPSSVRVTRTGRRGMPPYSCNICHVSYPEDYQGLEKHMVVLPSDRHTLKPLYGTQTILQSDGSRDFECIRSKRSGS
jgi:hypothetical protein